MASLSAITHSHPATRQDEWVAQQATRTTKAASDCRFIEIGAFDGLKHSNTLLLEESGWKGVLVEGNPDLMDSLRRNRPQAEVVEAVVAHKRGTGVFIKGGQYGGLERFMPDNWLIEHRRRKNDYIEVTTVTLGEIYEKVFCPNHGSVIDYLSVDTEGNEALILKSFQHLAMVNWITVEFRYDTAYLARLSDVLEPTHRLVKLSGFDAFYERKS